MCGTCVCVIVLRTVVALFVCVHSTVTCSPPGSVFRMCLYKSMIVMGYNACRVLTSLGRLHSIETSNSACRLSMTDNVAHPSICTPCTPVTTPTLVLLQLIVTRWQQ